ncbi:hypothetical protein [Neisseria sp. oral taxon 014]|uniref:hypothetical protein n=1 Tax=Neisseria sp. oral taxon 014 TaxID=641148 RepID=UPI00110B9D75|nr:hypothetical protein [Neisseria sp. oral taxon 014]
MLPYTFDYTIRLYRNIKTTSPLARPHPSANLHHANSKQPLKNFHSHLNGIFSGQFGKIMVPPVKSIDFFRIKNSPSGLFNPAGAFSANPFRRDAPMQTATLFLTYQK